MNKMTGPDMRVKAKLTSMDDGSLNSPTGEEMKGYAKQI
jgi:hypothetical protein